MTNKIIKLFSILFLTSFLFSACSDDGLEDIKVGSLYAYDFNNDIQIETLQDAVFYVRNEIEYKSDGIDQDYWQTPEQTYTLKTGDCEDIAILLMYILKDKLGIESCLLFVKNIYTEESHAMVFANDLYLLSTTNSINKNPPADSTIIHAIPYNEALWMAAYHHNNVGKYY